MKRDRRKHPSEPRKGRHRTNWAPAMLLLGVLSGCDVGAIDAPLDEKVVVEAFLFEGEPIDDIRLTQTVPLGATDTIGPPVDDAVVRLVKDNVVYQLTASDSGGHYYYPGSDLTVETDDHFRIEIDYFNKLATGETSVPQPPIGVANNSDTIIVPRPRAQIPVDPEDRLVRVTWENADGILHYVVVENVEEDPPAIFPEQLARRLNRFRLVSLPMTEAEFTVNLVSLRDMGRHKVTVYRINNEYAELFLNRRQDSRDLNEPPTNIQDGLGVFSAFNGESVFFEVVRQPIP